ncbi:hypothetical protein [Pinibacter soli]|uniref:Uncharacterized protein n=1 Tax=Pinibacter soli TaxID=3044211 RepID=A0ABT6R9Y0_9BACT|nr:hypothetical protein [Pinibacter soli]MDI3319374.1 hypothetical protein [Pinibacter soli]
MNLKKLLPIEYCTFTTHLSPQEVLKRIDENTLSYVPVRIPFFYEPPFEKPYRGKITGDTFTIKRNVEIRITYLPVITGHVFSDSGKTKVEIKMRPQTNVLLSTALILSILGLISLRIISSAVYNINDLLQFSFLPDQLLPFGAFVAIALWATIEFRFQSKKSKAFLQKLVEDEDVELF